MKLELRSDEPLPIVVADADRLHRAFSNLLDNAIKYSKEGGTILIATEENDQEVIVRIIDQGMGIDPSDLPYVFDPFHRGKDAQEKGGFGIGLSTAKAIAEGHGGRVLVKSELAVGTEFTVVLPKTRKRGEQLG
jgi:signal transduction histidine kinase